jgi:2-keto-4-pentenoate hydratase/2-oxohepta-3-ene-1,7-dioic acid hydratase in catechol pathway
MYRVKLATVQPQEGPRCIGLVEGDEVSLMPSWQANFPHNMLDLLELGDAGLELIRSMAKTAPKVPLANVKLCAPIQPRKLMALGINYQAHIAEMMERIPSFSPPSEQVWFNKQITSVTGPFDPLHRPKVSEMLDYEGELAIVIGKRCRHVSHKDAASAIVGYMICNDASVRDWQMATPTQTMGKSFDTHAPLGPWITTSDEIPDPQNLDVRVWVNSELRQSFNTSDMVFSCHDQIVHLSKAMTLEPGDVIATGTSIGNGVLRNPPLFLRCGDTVKISIDRLGSIENTVIDEPDATLFTREF